MVELTFEFQHPKFTSCTYKLIEVKKDVWTLFSLKGVQIGTLEKVNGKWEQTGGRQVLDEVVIDAGKLIDSNDE